MNDGGARPWKVVVVVEDDSDGRALREFVRVFGVRASFDWLPANGIGNIKRNGERLIVLAKDRAGRNGCVAVLVDRDGNDPAKAEPHRSIGVQCRRQRVPFLVAREAMEAWFLTDAVVCAWLGLPQPANTESLGNPKGVLGEAFFKKTGRTYRQRRTRLEVAAKLQRPDPGRNRSLGTGLAHLAECGAVAGGMAAKEE